MRSNQTRAIALLALSIVVAHRSLTAQKPECPVPPTLPVSGQSAAERLLVARRYPELAAQLSTHPPARSEERAYLTGVLANRRNEIPTSTRLLEGAVRTRYVTRDTTRYRITLETLADDYLKAYRYAGAARLLQRLDRDLGAGFTAEDREARRQSQRVRALLKSAPPQRVHVPADFSVPARRNPLELIEVPVTSAADSSWWILDTGANFSTITESFAKKLAVSLSRDTAVTRGITGTPIGIRLALIPSLRLGTATVSNVVTLVLPDSALAIPAVPFQIRAILGYPVLAALGRITVSPDRVSVRAGRRGTPDSTSNLYLEGLDPLVVASVAGRSHLYHFDSGANRSTLSVRFCSGYPELFAGLEPDSGSLTGAGATKRTLAYQLPAVTLMIGGVSRTLENVTVEAEPTASVFGSFFGNLGQDLVGKSGSYTLDFGRMTLTIEP